MKPRVPFLDLAAEVAEIRGELTDACGEVVTSGAYLNGPKLEQFEAEIGKRCGVRHVIGAGSGTQALQILLLAHGVGPGDEVVTTAASFFATAKAIALVGARPVLVDVCPDDFNIDPLEVERAITPRTKAVLAVHLYGNPVDVAGLRKVARSAGIPLLEDAAHAFGASIGGRPAGSLGDGAALSFYPTKNLGAFGDAGAVVVNDDETARRARAARFLGSSGVRDWFDGDGISGRMDEIQAAFLLVRLRHFERWQALRADMVERYRTALPQALLLPPARPGAVSAHHLFVIRHARRDRVAEVLASRGIETQVHYRVPLHRQPPFDTGQSLPVAEGWGRQVLSLPLNRALSGEAQEAVINAVLDAVTDLGAE